MADFNTAYSKVTNGKGFFITAAGEDVYKGIGRKSNPAWSGWAKIDDYKQYYGTDKSIWGRITADLDTNTGIDNLCRELYKKEYWDRMRLSEFTDQSLANLMFDFGTYRGISAAVKSLQTALNQLGNNLKVDGIIGTQTIAAVNKTEAIKLYSEVNAGYKTTVPTNVNAAAAIADKTEDITVPPVQNTDSKKIFGYAALILILAGLFIYNKKKKHEKKS